MNSIDIAYRKFSRSRFPLPSAKDVSDLEKRLGVSLPPDYRQYILEYNGGYFTEPRILPCQKECPLDRLTVLGGIGATHPADELGSERGFSPALFDDNEPPQVLPIGYTIMGNLIYLITHPEDCGSIGLKKAFSDQCFHLAYGIEEFFGLLREAPSQ